jgi:hypothetical protein
MDAVLHPEITVTLVGQDGNAFNLLGICQKAMRRAGLQKDEIDEFMADATNGDYDHLLQICMRWFTVE